MTGATAPVHDAAAPGSVSLFSRFFRSSLAISVIGLVGVALLLTLNWRQGRMTLYMANELSPTALAAGELMRGLSESQASLNAWVTLGEPRYRKALRRSWHEIIDPAVESLDEHLTLTDSEVESLLTKLRSLEESQWWVQEFAGSVGNDRADALLQLRLLPLLDSLFRQLEGLIALSGREAGHAAIDQGQWLIGVRSDLRLYQSLLFRLVDHREQRYLAQRIQRLDVSLSKALQDLESPRPDLLWSDLADGARADWHGIQMLSARFLQELEKAESNAARFVMRTRSAPLADEARAAASNLIDRVRQALATESQALQRSASDASTSALVILVLLAAASGLISWWFSHRLSRPVRALSDAATAFSRGERQEDLPLPRTREFADLTRSFNQMRRNIGELLTDLNNSNKELEQFAYTVSHDLRAPLRAIDGFSQALVEDYGDQLQGEAKEYLDLLSKGSRDMGRLIDDILWLSRSTRGEMNLENVDVSELAEEVIADLRRSEPGRVLEVSIQPGIMVHGDQRLLRNLLANLVGNAWKFTARSKPARIKLTSSVSDGRARITLEDNGVGFDMAYADKLFKPFHRLHNEQDFPGTGIGLSSVLRIVSRHRGHIEAWGAPGVGARFTLEFEKGKESEQGEKRIAG